jgi:hypothetical protein
MINRRVTRVVLNTTEVTDLLALPNSADFLPVFTTADALYIGYQGKFAARFIQLGTVPNAAAAALDVDYWDGSAWQDVDDFLDQTSVGGKALARSGFISWVNKPEWKASVQPDIDADVKLFWVRIKTSADLTAGMALSSILNVFCDDNLLRAYFPELITDPNFLPSGKTNFIDQYVEAKNRVVLRLKQRKLIQDESNIIEPNDVAVAATYAAAMLILEAIATSQDVKDLLKIAKDGFDEEIGLVDFAVDTDGDGVVTDTERTQSTSVGVFRR